MTATNTVSGPFDSFTVTEISSSPVSVYIPPLPKQLIETAEPMQNKHKVSRIDSASIIPVLKTLATLGALWLLGSALIALATLFVHIVMPIIVGLLLAYVLAAAIKNTHVGDLWQQMFCQNKQPVQPTPASQVNRDQVFVREANSVIAE